MQLDAINRVIEEFHTQAETRFSNLEIPAERVSLPPSERKWRVPCDPAGLAGLMAFVNALGVTSRAMEVSSNIAYHHPESPDNAEFEEDARAFAAVAALLSLPVVLNLGRVVCADPARLLGSAHPDTDPTRHPGVVTVLAYSSPQPRMPLERLSLVGDGRITRVEPNGDALPVPPPAGRWLRLLLP